MVGLSDAQPANLLTALSSVLAATNRGEIGQVMQPKPFSEFLAKIDHPSCAEVLTPNSAGTAPLARVTPASRFNGTTDDFEKAFPDLLRRAVVARKLDPQNFAEETKFVINAIKTCGPAKGGALASQQSDVCRPNQEVSNRLKPNMKPGDPAIELQMNLRNLASGGLPFTVRLIGGQTASSLIYDVIATGTIH
jgi:hypothetical protein